MGLSTRKAKFFDILSLNFAKNGGALLAKREKTAAHVKKILTLTKIYGKIIGGKLSPYQKSVIKTKNIKTRGRTR